MRKPDAPTDADDGLSAALASLAPPGVSIARRIIVRGDEKALLPAEIDGWNGRAARVLRQSGAARGAARGLLAGLGFDSPAIPRSKTGAPIWPPGIVGSLAHDDRVAVAAVARFAQFDALGIDVEPAAPLPADIIDIVTTQAERARYPATVVESRLLFCIKEAVYKALNPIDGLFLEFHDIEVDVDAGTGRTRQGRDIEIAAITSPRVVALAFRRAVAPDR